MRNSPGASLSCEGGSEVPLGSNAAAGVEAAHLYIQLTSTLGNFVLTDNQIAVASTADLDGAFRFMPQMKADFEAPGAASFANYPLKVPVRYWGAFTGFDRRPRDNDVAQGFKVSPREMAQVANLAVNTNLFFITAFNEWNERAVLELDQKHRFGAEQGFYARMLGAWAWTFSSRATGTTRGPGSRRTRRTTWPASRAS
mmetsp:Transcript_36701/g.116832  ORF Transcript_36701/g.116832 Transcript_36701/m.116832 type:complete len:199 (+) Transcript_36701:123-719(+)